MEVDSEVNTEINGTTENGTVENTTTEKTTAENATTERKASEPEKSNTTDKKTVKETISTEAGTSSENKTEEMPARATKKRKLPDDVAEKKAKRPKVVPIGLGESPESGVVLCVGDGDTGQLGLGEDTLDRTKPALVPGLPDNCVQVVAGGMHTVVLTSDGEVYSFGCNDEGALGRDGSEFDAIKVAVPGHVVQLSAGDSHTAALLDDGRVYAWGTFRDMNGKIGLRSDGQIQKLPVLLVDDVVVVKICSGSDHLLLLTEDGRALSVGNSEHGQLGRVQHCFSNRGGRKGISLLLEPAPVPIPRIRRKEQKVTDVWTGSYTSYFRVQSGAIYGTGLNNYYQLGLDDQELRHFPELIPGLYAVQDWRCISGGAQHTLALNKAGEVYVFGRKEYGRLGLGESCADAIDPVKIPSLSDVKAIAAGEHVSLALTQTGTLLGWGMGTSNQLACGDGDDVLSPTPMEGKQLKERKGVSVDSGGQHTVLLVRPAQ